MSTSRMLIAVLCLPFLIVPVGAGEIDGKSYEQWKGELDNPDPRVRGRAITVIPRFGLKAESVVPILVQRTRDKDDTVRAKAVIAFHIVAVRGSDRLRVVKALGHCVAHDALPLVRYEAARALPRFGLEVREVVDELAQGMGDSSHWEIRQICIDVVRTVGADAKNGPKACVTDALILRTKAEIEPTAQVRLHAVIALGALGPPRDAKKLAQVIAALKENYLNKNKSIRIWARASSMILQNRANKDELETMAGYLKDPDQEVRAEAVAALGALQTKAQPQVPNILRLLKDESEPQVIATVCDALPRIGDRSEPVLKALIKLTQRKDAESINIVLSACAALVQLGLINADVRTALNNVLEREDVYMQRKDTVRQLIEQIRKPRDESKPQAEFPRNRDHK